MRTRNALIEHETPRVRDMRLSCAILVVKHAEAQEYSAPRSKALCEAVRARRYVGRQPTRTLDRNTRKERTAGATPLIATRFRGCALVCVGLIGSTACGFLLALGGHSMFSHDKWVTRVGHVFDTNPRVNTDDHLWLPRPRAIRDLSEALERCKHVCLDGPSGVGKTSLALSYLHDRKVEHSVVQCTRSMDWVEFCRQVISPPPNAERGIDFSAEGGVDKGLPVLKFRIALGSKHRPSDDRALLDATAKAWTEADPARSMAEDGVLLMVDDLERAQESLLERLADLGKLLTQSFVHERARLLFVGTGDVYRQLCRKNRALDDRMAQSSLGAFRSPHDSWRFLLKGFDELKLRHPGNSVYSAERERGRASQEAVWEAADGLPKSLNLLGKSIGIAAGRGGVRRNVSAHDIRQAADTMVNSHLEDYIQEYPSVLLYLHDNDSARFFVRHLYESGIAAVYRLQDLSAKIELASRRAGSPITATELDRIVDELASLRFLIRTGRSGEVIFIADPTAAHTLGVAMRDDKRYGRLTQFLKQPAQLRLAFQRQADLPPESDES